MQERVVKKSKDMTCGHNQIFTTPVPQAGEYVFCRTCDKVSRITPRLGKTIANGRPSRAKEHPKSNNQFTKGRKLTSQDLHGA